MDSSGRAHTYTQAKPDQSAVIGRAYLVDRQNRPGHVILAGSASEARI